MSNHNRLPSGRCSKCRHRCRHCNLINIGFVLSALSIISSAITIAYFTVRMTDLEVYDYLYSYQSSTCVPVNGMASSLVSNVSCPNPWIMLFVLADGRRAVTNPFAGQETRLQSIDDRNRITLGQNYSCLCRPNSLMITNNCSVWPQCIFNGEFVKFMQRDNDRYYSTFVSFIIASAISASLSIFAIPSSIQLIHAKCKESPYTEMD